MTAALKTYRLAMTAFGLSRGDTFSSTDKEWEKYVEAGVLVKVGKDKDADVLDFPTGEEPNDGVQ